MFVDFVSTGGSPPHRCKFPDGYSEKDIPIEKDTDGNSVNSSCFLYTNTSYSNETTSCPMEWDFFGDHGRTIVTEVSTNTIITEVNTNTIMTYVNANGIVTDVNTNSIVTDVSISTIVTDTEYTYHGNIIP